MLRYRKLHATLQQLQDTDIRKDLREMKSHPSLQTCPRRDIALDAIKGVLIFLVCLGHEPLFWKHYPGAVQFLYTFHIPLFLAVSCSVICARTRRELVSFARKRTIRIIPSFLAWLLIYGCLAVVAGRVSYQSPGDTSTKLACAIGMANIASLRALTSTALLWFLPTLLCTNLLFAVIRCYSRREAYGLVVASGLWCALYPYLGHESHALFPWGFDTAVYVMPLCFAVAVVYSLGVLSKWQVSVFSTFTAAVFGFFIYGHSVGRGLQSMILPQAWSHSMMCDAFCLTCFMSMAGLFTLFLRRKDLAFPIRILAVLGRHSFAIYVTHPIVFKALSAFQAVMGVTVVRRDNSLALAVLFVIAATGCGVLFSKVLGWIPGLGWLLLGVRSPVRQPPTPVDVPVKDETLGNFAGT